MGSFSSSQSRLNSLFLGEFLILFLILGCDFFWLKNKGNIPPNKNPPARQIDSKTPMGIEIDWKAKNFKLTRVIFWMEKTEIAINQKPIIKEINRLFTIEFLNP